MSGLWEGVSWAAQGHAWSCLTCGLVAQKGAPYIWHRPKEICDKCKQRLARQRENANVS